MAFFAGLNAATESPCGYANSLALKMTAAGEG